MLLREALALLRSPSYSDTHRLCLVCSFEPLHFKTYLQAFLVERFPEAAPQVTSWGYDQLEAGLQESSRALRSEEHTSELQSQSNLVCRLLLEKKKKNN